MKTLCLHTAHFPYGLGEQFIETEIKYLAKAFERVVVIPASREGEKRSLPPNVEVLTPNFAGYSTSKGIKNLGGWFVRCIKDILKSSERSITLSTLLRAGYQANTLFEFLKAHNLVANTLHYTYWFNEQSTQLSILKSKKLIKDFISRAHGFDLYEERNKLGYIPFRKFQLKNVSKLFLISKNGLDYMEERYPQYKEKYELAYLGIENNHPFQFQENEKKPYLLVSCSRVVDIKRVDLILKALALIKELPIHWVHFGDGPLFEEVKKDAEETLKGNITFEFKGMVPNTEVLKYYQTHCVDCFINVSTSEGLPVSIMEAVGYGIPIVATNVGGTSEIVNSITGFLLPKDVSAKEISDSIIKILVTKSKNRDAREDIYAFWQNYFDAKKNYQEFCETLQQHPQPPEGG